MAAPVAESKMAPVPESKTTPVSEPETPPAPHSDAAPLQEHSALDRRVGQSTAVVMPLLELGAIGYATWVFIYLICVQYLINPSLELRRDHNVQPRRATGIALIVVYAILLLLLLIHFMRLLLLIWTKPDLVPLGDDSIEKKDASVEWLGEYDAYICDYDGMPRWCHKCHNWKPDRAHHCKELGRCVRRMDHYCPWAGGIIAETTHKSFVQFTFYGALYTLCIWLVVAIFLADRSSKNLSPAHPGTWIGALCVGLFFFVFTFTMTGMTGWNLCINYTSVEGIQRGGVKNIAFLISRSQQGSQQSTPSEVKQQTPEDWPVLCTVQRSSERTYVVMQTKPLEHPWYTDLMSGFRDTMGDRVIDWFNPFKLSPCKQKTQQGEFQWGGVVHDMAKKYEEDNPGTQLAILH